MQYGAAVVGAATVGAEVATAVEGADVGDALGQPGARSSQYAPLRQRAAAMELTSPSTQMLSVEVEVPEHPAHSRGLYVSRPSVEYRMEPTQAFTDGPCTSTPKGGAE